MGTTLEKQKLEQLEHFYTNNWKCLLQKGNLKNINKITQLYHYTSIETLFIMLENDTLRFSNLRLSNDFSEEKLLGEKWLSENNFIENNYFFCVGEAEDLLSQWRGYCVNGGVAIGFDISKSNKYCALYSNFKETKKYENVYCMAVPVLYTQINYNNARNGAHQIIEMIEEIIEEDKSDYTLLNKKDFVPYIKHYAFHEEQERRLLINNSNNNFSNCIGFRTLPNGTKSSFIDVKCGIIEESSNEDISDLKIKEIIDNNEYKETIIIPICKNQEELYLSVYKYIKLDKKYTSDGEIRIFCDGHIPVRSIKIGPMPDQERIKEQVQIFCKSKYWLQDVEISISTIPYITSINSK